MSWHFLWGVPRNPPSLLRLNCRGDKRLPSHALELTPDLVEVRAFEMALQQADNMWRSRAQRHFGDIVQGFIIEQRHVGHAKDRAPLARAAAFPQEPSWQRQRSLGQKRLPSMKPMRHP